MEDIDVEKICDVITFLQDNEQYGDDWSDAIAEQFYRHWDGYPTGHGADIAMALLNASLTERKKYIRFDGKKCDESVLNNRNWCQHFLKELCKQDIELCK